MESVDKVFYLSDYIDLNESIKHKGRGSLGHLYISDTTLRDSVYKKLKKIPFLDVYRRGELPEKYGYNNSPRVGDIILSAHSHYYMKPSRSLASMAKPLMKGTHGYNPFLSQNKNMQGIFYAQGPQILNKGQIPAFENIHIYPFIMEILGLEIRTEIDGDKSVLRPYIDKKKSHE